MNKNAFKFFTVVEDDFPKHIWFNCSSVFSDVKDGFVLSLKDEVDIL